VKNAGTVLGPQKQPCPHFSLFPPEEELGSKMGRGRSAHCHHCLKGIQAPLF